MKIAMTYGKEINTVFQHFGRTEYFYIFDTETNGERVFKIILKKCFTKSICYSII